MTRGYIGCIYPGADARDVSHQWQAAYPKESMALIMTRAFIGSRTLDFLLQPSKYLPSNGPHGHGLPAVRAGEVAVSGHSRNGKQTLIFAAFDDRVTAAVGSSPGAPIASPYRFTSSNFYGEGPKTGGVTGEGTVGWWIPSALQYVKESLLKGALNKNQNHYLFSQVSA